MNAGMHIPQFLRDGYVESATNKTQDTVTYTGNRFNTATGSRSSMHSQVSPPDEYSSLIERAQEEELLVKSESIAGGTILGIHNLAVVLPQFLVGVDKTHNAFSLIVSNR